MEVEWCEKVGGREREACGKVNKNFGIGRDEDFHVWSGRRPTRGNPSNPSKDQGSRHGRPPGSIRTPIFERSLVILGRI